MCKNCRSSSHLLFACGVARFAKGGPSGMWSLGSAIDAVEAARLHGVGSIVAVCRGSQILSILWSRPSPCVDHADAGPATN